MSIIHSLYVQSASLVFVGLGVYFLRKLFTTRRDDVPGLPSPPSEEASWIWGHERQVWDHGAAEMHSKWASVIGTLFRIKAALRHPDIIIAADRVSAQHILQNTDTYVMADALRKPAANLIGKGVVWALGEQHKRMRRVLAPSFSPESIKRMAGDVFDCAEKLESRLMTDIMSKSVNGNSINIAPYISACALDIIGRVAFGHDFSAQSTPPSEDARRIFTSWHDIIVDATSEQMFVALPVIRMLPWLTDLPIPALRAQGITNQIVRRIAHKLIANARLDSVVKGNDVLSMLLRSVEKEKGGLSDEEIIENIITFTMVGHETTAGSINFTLLALSRNPAAQEKLRTEIRQQGSLSYDSIQKLEYLDAVVREALRVHPASPQTERVTTQDDVIPLGKPITKPDGTVMDSVHVSAGQIIIIPFKTINTDATVWGPDATEFKPERWLTPGGIPSPADLPRGWSGLLSFSDGPRNCLGFRLAVLEFKVMLAMLIRSFKFEDVGSAVVPKIAPTLQPIADGRPAVMPLRITPVME
ncbi:cytochrome P450 [Punctularia strigosozonata HHB-11173 SS5]|uniref:cytochrome P450 n=1 Tax=Punctularia strigosozonata (strain HHB-11173) TaxID=741275 RepID=UPI0004417437|nr:cytochrome P450 [Punctularia strigosozonata HHB-11173 SS5]EIN08207.1 cytochrome P450 [Punctularia strigosozonata HHB-11173 SS5]